MRRALLAAMVLVLAACGRAGSGAQLPGDMADSRPFAGIAKDEVVNLVGTEPFWGGKVAHNRLTYSTPENVEGVEIEVTRFSGRGGLSFSGELDGKRLDLLVTPAPCSDGMSDRSYPFVATLKLGDETRTGCAWSQQHPFSGDQAP